MTNEETPLLLNEHELIYNRFSKKKKQFLVAIVSWGGLVACESPPLIFNSAVLVVIQSSLLEPFYHQSLRLPKNSTRMAKSSGGCYWTLAVHLSSEQVTSTLVSIYLLATSLGGLVGSKYSKFCEDTSHLSNCPSLMIHRWPSTQLSMVSTRYDIGFFRRCARTNCESAHVLAYNSRHGCLP